MIKVFVGSSVEHQEIAKQVALSLEDANCTARAWWLIFELGDFTLQRLIQEAYEVDAAIFVFSPDDKTWYRKAEFQTPRDNVVFEYGLFLGRHGLKEPKRAIVLRVGGAKLPSDVNGVTYMPFDPAKPETFKSNVKKWVEKVRMALDAEAKQVSQPKH